MQELKKERERFDEAAQKSEAANLTRLHEKQRLKQGGNAMSAQQSPSTSNKVLVPTKPRIGRVKPRVGRLKGNIT